MNSETDDGAEVASELALACVGAPWKQYTATARVYGTLLEHWTQQLLEGLPVQLSVEWTGFRKTDRKGFETSNDLLQTDDVILQSNQLCSRLKVKKNRLQVFPFSTDGGEAKERWNVLNRVD